MSAPRNEYLGSAERVIQAGSVQGGIHLYGKTSQALPVPRQLPREVAWFTNRADEVEKLDTLISADNKPDVVLICGVAGVGKTAFSVHWAHSTRERFPDGQLYVNLRGYDPLPAMTAEEVLDGFLRALNVPPAHIPNNLQMMSGLYRSITDGKRLLVMLDNASSAAQIRPILASSYGCLTIVTSRNRMAGLVARDGATRIALSPLSPSEAMTLLSRVSGQDLQCDAGEAAMLVLQCGYLPLTIRITGEQVSERGTLGLDELIEELAAEGGRLSAFSTTDGDQEMEVRKVFSWSYRALSPQAAHMFRLLGTHAGPSISVPSAAALASVSISTARRLLETLASASMLEDAGQGRYQFHDLVREYALERAEDEESSEDRNAALIREISFYLHTADAADRALAPQRRHVPLDEPDPTVRPLSFATPSDALAWCEAERPNLIPAIEQAYRLGFYNLAWKLPIALIIFLDLRNHRENRLNVSLVAIKAARQAKSQYGEAWGLISVGGAELDMDRCEEAIVRFDEALQVCRKIGDRQGEYMSLGNIAHALYKLGRYAKASDYSQQSIAVSQQLGDGRAQAIQLGLLGAISIKTEFFDDAYAYYARALALTKDVDLQIEGSSLQGLGEVCSARGEYEAAIAWYELAVVKWRKIGNQLGAARSLSQIGRGLVAAGKLDPARAALAEAISLFDELRDPQGNQVRRELEQVEGRGSM